MSIVRFMILGKYPLDLDGGELLEALRAAFESTGKIPVKDRTYFHFIRSTNNMTDLNDEAAAIEHFVNQLPSIKTATHYFGGIGVSASILRTLKPKIKQQVIDIAEDCILCLRRQGHTAVLDNSLANWEKYVSDLCVLDFNTFSLLHKLNDTVEWRAVSGILAHPRSRYLITLDTACAKYQMNREVYHRRLGVKDLPDYRRLWERTLADKGWYVIDWCHNRNADVMLLGRK